MAKKKETRGRPPRGKSAEEVVKKVKLTKEEARLLKKVARHLTDGNESAALRLGITELAKTLD